MLRFLGGIFNGGSEFEFVIVFFWGGIFGNFPNV